MEDFLEKYLSIKDLITIGVVYFVSRKKVNEFIDSAKVELSKAKDIAKIHFDSIEKSLKDISQQIQGLNSSLTTLEDSQTKKLNHLGERVTIVEDILRTKIKDI